MRRWAQVSAGGSTSPGRDAILAMAGTRGGTEGLLLDPRLVRASPDAVKEATRVKGIASPELVDAWLAADEARRRAQAGAEALRAEQRKLSDRIGALKRQLGAGAAPELEGLMARGDELKQAQQALAEAQAAAETEAEQIMLQLPAIPDPAWPVGADAGDNRVVRTWADPSCAPAPLAATPAGSHRARPVPRHPRLRARRQAGRFALLRAPRGGRPALLGRAALRAGHARPPRLRALRGSRSRRRAVHDRHRLLPGRARPGLCHPGQVRPGRHQRGAARQLSRRRDPERSRPAQEVQRAEHVLPPRGRRRRQGHGRPVPRPPVRQGRAGRDPQGRRAGAHRASRGDPRQRREHPAGPEAALPRRPELHRRHGPGQVAHVRHRDVDAEPRALRRDALRQRAQRVPGPPPRPPLPTPTDPRDQEPEPAVLLHPQQHRHRLPACADRLLELYQQPDGSVAVPDVLRPYMAGLDRIAR